MPMGRTGMLPALADGTFTLDGVPPGSYELRVWHESLGEQVVDVTVEAGKTASIHVTY